MAKQDLTNCSPYSGLVKFAIPLVLGNMLQQFYNLMDILIVGRYCGSTALAAVCGSTPILVLYTCVSIGGGLGAGVIIAQMYGARRYGDMMTAIKTTVLSFFAIGALLMVVGFFINEPLLALIKTPADVFGDAALYMRIYFYGFLFTMMFNVCNGVFNALGDSRKPLTFLAICAVLNIGLNILFITRLGMTVDGVAWATIISQGIALAVSAATLIVKLRRMNITEKSIWFDASILKRIFKVAGPSILQQSIVSVGHLTLQPVVNGFGSVAMAAYAAANRIDLLVILPMANMGNAVSSFTAQNIGAKKYERIPQGLKAALILAVGISACISAMILFFGEGLVSLFVTGEDAAEVIALGANFLRISACFYFVFGIMHSFCGVLRGSGDMTGFMLATFANFFLRTAMAYIVAAGIGLHMIAWCTVSGWIIHMVLAIWRYKFFDWRKKKLI